MVFHTLDFLNSFSSTRRYKRHQNAIKVKRFDFFHGSMKKFNQLAKKKYLKFFSLP